MVELACIWEATVPKPGNVHPGASFVDMCYDDFVRSARAIAPVLGHPEGKSVGQLVLESVQATQRAVGKNTNLGIILLLAPMVKAFSPRPFRPGAGSRGDVPSVSEINMMGFAPEEDPSPPTPLPGGERGDRHAIAEVLQQLTVDDARLVYQAIRLTQPGGLGKVDTQDVSEEPTITLLEAMHLAAERDLIARQYVNGYREVWEVLLPAFESKQQGRTNASGCTPSLQAPLPPGERGMQDAIVHTFLVSLATLGDTLIARKCGTAVAEEAQRQAAEVLAGRQSIEELDAWLRADGHRRNPGTTADLVCATLFLAFLRGTLPNDFPLEYRSR
jgi:triphosphoribosyl-dephospho-CoA synthase